MTAPQVHTPADLPDLRLWLAEQWTPGRPFARAAAPYHSARADRLHSSRQHLADQAIGYAAHERQVLHHATLWWVAEPMVDLLLAAAAGVPEDTTMADLPPMPTNGLVMFAKPWLGIDGTRAGYSVQVDALAWGMVSVPAQEGPGRRLAMAISTYRRVDFGMGLTPDELTMVAATGAMDHATPVPVPNTPEARYAADVVANATVGKPDDYAHASTYDHHPEYGTFVGQQGRAVSVVGTTWVPLGRSDWPVTDTVGTPPWGTESDTEAASMVEDRKVVAAMWHLLHQEGIAQQTVHAPERQAARRTQRAGVAKELASVRVVTLRRLHRTESAPTDDHAHREWSHRWLVAGHWRWARVGVGRTERRLTFVRPHVKGPEDRPLRVPTTVNAWQR